jgi:hypothetical protein
MQLRSPTSCLAAGAMALGLAALAAACSPALDWRQWRPAGTGVTLLMPCKPTPQSRRVSLAGASVELVLEACSAGGQTWALAHADVGDPQRVGPALVALLDGAAANVGAGSGAAAAWRPVGATPNPAAGRRALQGWLPDGRAVREQVAVFAVGTRVFQVTALGESLPDEAADAFFASVRAGG